MACCCRSGIWCMYFSVLDSLYGQDSPLRLRALLRCFEEEFNAEKKFERAPVRVRMCYSRSLRASEPLKRARDRRIDQSDGLELIRTPNVGRVSTFRGRGCEVVRRSHSDRHGRDSLLVTRTWAAWGLLRRTSALDTVESHTAQRLPTVEAAVPMTAMMDGTQRLPTTCLGRAAQNHVPPQGLPVHS